MVKTALNSKRKLIYSIKWYAFIIVQVVKFMHKRVTCKWFWAIYLSFHFVFGKFSSAILDKDLFTVTTFLLQSFFLVQFFVWIILFISYDQRIRLFDGREWSPWLCSFSLSFFLCIRYNLWGTIQILWQLFYYLNFVYLLLLLFNFHDMKMNCVHGKYSFVSKFRSRLVVYIDYIYIYISIYYKYKIYVMFYIVF